MRLTFPSGYRHTFLLVLLVLLPLLARADALDGLALMLEILAGLAGIFLLGIGLTLRAYFRPQARSLQIISGVGLVLNLFAGLLWQWLFNSNSSLSSLLQGYNPFLSLAVPLGLWLGGVTLARRETRPGRLPVWVATAVFGAHSLLGPLLQLLLWNVLEPMHPLAGGLRWGGWALNLLLLFGIWWLVLKQAQRYYRLDWHTPRLWMWAPTLSTGISIVFSFVMLLLTIGRNGRLAETGDYLVALLGFGVVSWAVGVLAVRLNQRCYAASAAAE